MAVILSIDDDPGLQDLLAHVLRGRGHDVHWAFSGEEGFEKAQSLRPQLIILDMMLPTLNGVEVLKLLKAHAALRDTPVIVATAFFGEAPFTENAVKALGAFDFLKKPVQLDVLQAVIDSALASAPSAPQS
ncbi:MAG: response regulator transcription factor [Elusimicrobiota bacterium]